MSKGDKHDRAEGRKEATMTRAEIELSTLEFLTPEQAAGLIGCNPYAINVQAKEDPAKLGFPVCVMGTRVRIPRRAFLRWLDGGAARAMTDEQVRAEFDRLREAIMREMARACRFAEGMERT